MYELPRSLERLEQIMQSEGCQPQHKNVVQLAGQNKG
jgi:hypothetical protein